MKIALACANFPPEFLGGTERVTLALAKALQRTGDEVVIVTGSERPHAGADVCVEHMPGATNDILVYRIPRHPHEPYGLDLRRARVLTVVENLLMDQAVQVLHVHHWATLSTRLVRSARALGLGAVVTLHDMWTSCGRFFRRPPSGITCPTGAGREACGPCVALDLSAPLERLRAGITYRDHEIHQELVAAHAVVAPSMATARAVARHVPWPHPIEVLPHGLLELPRQKATRPTSPSQPLRIGTFGNHVPDKGLLVLLEAMADVPAELHLFGRFLDPSFEVQVRTRCRDLGLTLNDHGAYSPELGHPALSLDLSVFPSLCEETYGLVVEESLAHGVPVVVSDSGALAERIGAAGLVVPAGDVPALHRVLHDMATDPALLSNLRRGIQKPVHTIDGAAARYRELYQRSLP